MQITISDLPQYYFFSNLISSLLLSIVPVFQCLLLDWQVSLRKKQKKTCPLIRHCFFYQTITSIAVIVAQLSVVWSYDVRILTHVCLNITDNVKPSLEAVLSIEVSLIHTISMGLVIVRFVHFSCKPLPQLLTKQWCINGTSDVGMLERFINTTNTQPR